MILSGKEIQKQVIGQICGNQEGGVYLTIQELSQLYHLNREIEQEKRRLQELEAAVNRYGGENIWTSSCGRDLG